MLRAVSHPARAVPAAFLLALSLGTLLLLVPLARVGPEAAPFITALFTATSAICVTGLVVVDTGSYWSPFGQVVILALFQLGGLGIMSGATLLGVLVSRRLQLNRRLIAQAETHSIALGDVVSILKLVIVVTFVLEAILAVWLTLWLWLAHGEPFGLAAWHGLFHAVSAFNNAGFSTYSDSLMGFSRDIGVLGPIMLAVIIGGIGFPVLYELRKVRDPKRWSIHTKVTLLGTVTLLIVGMVATAAYEWNNPGTLGGAAAPERLLSAAFHSVMTRTAGFNSVDVGQMRSETLAVSYVLMLIGGGSAGTAGGIKVTTFFILGFVVWSEVRGEPDVNAFSRRISSDVQRDAITIVLLAIGLIGAGSLILLSVTSFTLEDVLFEAISAFATVGLSTGITGDLPPVGQITLVVLMFVGRVGTITAATALALRRRRGQLRYPEERPIVG